MASLRRYSKETFIKYIEKNNVSDNIIEKFKQLPEIINHKDSEFILEITSTWYDVGTTHYAFEMNYYSENLIEYIFSPKVFTDIDKCINYLLSELNGNDFLKK